MVHLTAKHLLFVLFAIAFIVVGSYFVLNLNKEEIVIEGVEEKNYLRDYPEIYEKYGAISSNFYVVKYRNKAYTCENVRFKDEETLLKNIKDYNMSIRIGEMLIIESNNKTIAFMIKKDSTYSCVSYTEGDKQVTTILNKVFKI